MEMRVGSLILQVQRVFLPNGQQLEQTPKIPGSFCIANFSLREFTRIAVVDFVPFKAQAIHKDQQGRSRSAGRIHCKALRNHRFQ